MSTRFIPTFSRGWLMEELYGWRQAPSIAACRVPYLYAKAMLYASGASQSRGQQRSYVAGMLSAHFAGGIDSDLLQYVEHFDRAGQTAMSDLETASRTRRLPGVNARVIVYDAASTAIADRVLSDDAVADVTSVAKELGVSAKCARRITTLCERESGLADRRRKLLMGDETSVVA